jgi:hypothetical protein
LSIGTGLNPRRADPGVGAAGSCLSRSTGTELINGPITIVIFSIALLSLRSWSCTSLITTTHTGFCSFATGRSAGSNEIFVYTTITIVVLSITDFGTGRRRGAIPPLSGGTGFGPCSTAILTNTAQIFVHLSITVVVLAITDLGTSLRKHLSQFGDEVVDLCAEIKTSRSTSKRPTLKIQQIGAGVETNNKRFDVILAAVAGRQRTKSSNHTRRITIVGGSVRKQDDHSFPVGHSVFGKRLQQVITYPDQTRNMVGRAACAFSQQKLGDRTERIVTQRNTQGHRAFKGHKSLT